MNFSTDCQIIRCNLHFEINQLLYGQKSGQWNVHGIWVGPRSKVYLASNKSWKINNLPFNILKLVHTQEWKLPFKVILNLKHIWRVWNFYSAIDGFFQLWKNLIFTAFSCTKHKNTSKNISAAKYDPCGYNEWRDPQKPSQILNRLCKKTLSSIIIRYLSQ